MKKLLIALIALMVLAGCTDGNTTLSNSEALISVNGKELAKSDLYEILKRLDGGSIIMSEAQNMLLKSLIGDSAELDEKVQERLAEIKVMLGDYYEEYITSYGFVDDEDIIENLIKPDLRALEALTIEITEDFDALVAEYAPRKVRILRAENAEKANEALAKIEAGEDFATVAAEYAVSTTYVGTEQIITLSDTTLETTVLDYAVNVTSGTNVLSGVLDVTDSDEKHIVLVTEADPNNFKDEMIETFAAMSDLNTLYMAELFREHGFTVYDSTIYDFLLESYETYLSQ